MWSTTHTEEDKQHRHAVETRNRGDALVYNTEKILDEQGDKVDQTTQDQVKKAIEDLKKALQGQDVDAIEAACDRVEKTAQKFGEAVYAKANAAGQAQAEPTEEASAEPEKDEKVVDAEFESEDDKEAKK